MSRLNYSRVRHEDNARRYGTEALNGSSPVPSTPRPPRTAKAPQGAQEAAYAALHAVRDVGVRFALEAAAQGLSVHYAADWSPGSTNEERLRAAGVTVTVCRPRR